MPAHRKHGDSLPPVAPEYTCWVQMKQRCYNTCLPKYLEYGARGITVCDRWRDSYHDFLADMGRRPSDKHSIDRIDNDGNYEPGNCRWALADVQNKNKRYKRSHRGDDLTTLNRLSPVPTT